MLSDESNAVEMVKIMKADLIVVGRTYRMKPEVFSGCNQANGEPFTSPDVTIVRLRYPEGRKRAFYYDAAGNAFRSDDFKGFADRQS